MISRLIDDGYIKQKIRKSDRRMHMMGRLTRDPELRTAGNTPVCSFRIACDRDYKPKAQEGDANQPPEDFAPDFNEEGGELPF